MCGSLLNELNVPIPRPEDRISLLIAQEARVHIDPRVIRLIVKYRWDELAKAAHEIHGGAGL